MDLLEKIKTLGQNIFDLVFPVSCLVCGKEGVFLCDQCLKVLPKEMTQKCLICNSPTPFGKTHKNCVSKNTVDGLISALPYQNTNVKKIIETFKYNFISDLAQPLSILIIEEIKNQGLNDYFSEFEIIPVPLHKRRFDWRGFNQAELLALPLANQLAIPLKTGLVLRTKFTKPQVKLTLEERKQNIHNAFVLTKNDLLGQKFLVLDDVATSGSTLNEIAKLLKKAGSKEVWGITVAHG